MMMKAERCYFMVYGILLYTVVNLAAELIMKIITALAVIIFQAPRPLVVISVVFNILFFVLIGGLAIAGVVVFTGKNSMKPRPLPFTSLIVMTALVPGLYLFNVAGGFLLQPLYVHFFSPTAMGELTAALSIQNPVAGFLRCSLLAVLAIIAIVRLRRTAAPVISTAP